jgi:hypothetical protein
MLGGICLLVVVMFVPTGSRGQDDAPPPMEGLRIPMQHYPDGAVKMQLRAEKARVLPNNDIVGERICVETFDQDGALTAMILADNGGYDRRNEVFWTPKTVLYESGNVAISGTGARWDVEKMQLDLQGDVKIVIRRERGASSIFLPTGTDSQPKENTE